MKNKLAGIIVLMLLAMFSVSCSDSDDNGLFPDGDTENGTDGDSDTSITVPYVVVSGSVAIEVGKTITLQAQTINGTDSGYTWGSTDEVIATVDENGAVTGVSAGEASITATGKDSGKTGSWGVYVYVLPEEGSAKVTISGEVALEIGDTTTLTATTSGASDSAYTWESSDDAKATIDANGQVTGVAAGEVIITATGNDSGESGQWGMYIYAPPVEIPTVTISGGYSVIVGQTLALTAVTNNGTDSAYAWSSSSDAIATVDAATGVVTGIAAGEVTITATGADTNVSGQIGIVVINPEQDIPYEELWKTSGHADSTSEAFRHWDEDGAVPTSCAKCHSTYGYLDFLGEDGSAAGTVENEAATDSVVSCIACHNQSTAEKSSVVFPSGMTVEGLDASSRCMECHQGRESTVSVNDSITAAEVTDDDTVDSDLRFKNVHYAAAGATLVGTEGMGAYEYDGMSYDGIFAHVENVDSCVSCHDSHTLEVKAESCAACHGESRGDYKDIRMAGSLMDYDGDGNISEGIYYEIEGLREKLYEAIQAYAEEVAGTALVYDEAAYPYFFADANGNGTVDEGESGYSTWTARLVKATYNYQYALKDKGAFAHNAKYVIEVLFDSIGDLNTALDTPVTLEGTRNDSGHFDNTAEAWRHWDSGAAVEANCAKCHSAEGLPFYLEHGVNFEQPQAASMACITCHDNVADGDFSTQHSAESVMFPSGEVIDSGSNSSNLCMQCHQGRESKVSVDSYIASKVPAGEPIQDDVVYTGLGFRNVHYLAAGATRYGSDAMGGYEYDGKVYDGFFEHVSSVSQCTDCHNTHNQSVKLESCADCHEGVATEEDLEEIRMASSVIDYNGNGDTEEGIYHEIEGLREKLYEAIQAYASEAIGPYIIYSESAYPYWFIDTNMNGQVDAGETTNANKYAQWTPRLVKATYNFQYSLKDPGAFAHNAKYVIELLFDSIEDINSVLSTPIEFDVSRNDSGHFDPTSEAWRHWDADGAVQASCARCHSGAGLDYYAANGTNPTVSMPVSWGLTCENCHSSIGSDRSVEAPVKYLATAVFPSGTTVNNNAEAPDNSFLCLTCHVGRESKTSVDAAITAGTFGFKNVHYAPAGSMLYGADAHVGYEYTGKTYQTKFTHGTGSASANCAYCHTIEGEAHSFEPELHSSCLDCHDEASIDDIESIRKNRSGDYNGNGNTTEPLADEVEGLITALYLQMQTYCTNTLTSPIIYDANTYPYFFKDTNGNGQVDAGEATNANKFTAWNATVMKAAFNFQFAKKESGAWAHNTKYVVQLLIDSIEDLGGNVSAYSRP